MDNIILPFEGKCMIVSATNVVSYPVGANTNDTYIKNVVTGGFNNIWTATKLDNGNYTLSLREPVGLHSWDSNGTLGDVVVQIAPAAAEWTIGRPKGELRGLVIAVPYTDQLTQVWTVHGSVPGTEIKLKSFNNESVQQLWRFIPLRN